MRARVVNPEATEQEIKQVIESGRGSQIFMQAVSSPLFSSSFGCTDTPSTIGHVIAPGWSSSSVERGGTASSRSRPDRTEPDDARGALHAGL
jgi:hypothetical protein